MAGKYKNLAPKIQKCRTRAKLSQENLAKVFGITRTAVTQWESKDPKNRTEPNPRQLNTIARLHGKDYWWYLAWFMDDEVEADRGVDYNHFGDRIALEPLFSEEEVSAMWAQMRPTEDWQQVEPEGWFAEALANSPDEGLEKIRRKLREDPPDRQGPNQFLHGDPTTGAAEGAPASNNKRSGEELGATGSLQAQTGSKLAASASKTALRRPPSEFEDDEVWKARSKNFVASVEHRLARHLPLSHKYLDVEIWTGSLRRRADYFDGAALIEFCTSRWKHRGGTLFDGMGRLLLTERMINRNISKMLVICIDVSDPGGVQRLNDEKDIAKSLGIDLLYANPDQDEKIAEEMNKFIRHAHAIRPRSTTKDLLG